MKYPLRGDYDIPIRYLDRFVFDNILNTGKPVMQTRNPMLLRLHSGGKATVYEIQTTSKKYALKCWIEDLGDLKIRYKAIDDYFKQTNIPYFVDFAYNEEGILVNGKRFPIVRMEWIDGISFRTFISNNINNPRCIREFAEKFLEMVKTLHQNNISHGDLQHGNIMVRNNGDICLIDYDSLYVPQLSNEKDVIKGLDGYQHPYRNKLVNLSPKSDYFSELIIYLSLIVIAEKPSYWKNIEQEERLLFSKKDLTNPRSSSIFGQLTKLSSEISYLTLELEKFCRQPDIQALQPLEDLVNAYGGSKISWDFVPNIKPSVSSQASIPVDLGNTTQNVPVTNNIKSPSATESTTDPWDAIDNFSQNIPVANKVKSPPVEKSNIDPWAKIVGVKSSKSSTKDPWDKFGKNASNAPVDKLPKPSYREPSEPYIDQSIWGKFDRIWQKISKSTLSVWNKFIGLFN